MLGSVPGGRPVKSTRSYHLSSVRLYPINVCDLSDAYILACKHRAEVYLSPSNTDPATLSDLDRAVVEGVLWQLRMEELPRRGCIHFTRIAALQ